ncbi:MAG: ribosome small subunit-dependent GTPase A [Candidatus Cloacimonadota bacterium]|nr:MAG: ribosome small subunit-dependent GTPase A [Candidatus Cloacimonadota bacterium]
MKQEKKAIISGRFGGYYFVLDQDLNRFACKLKGSLKKLGNSRNLAVAGDQVLFQKIDDDKGQITKVFPRKSTMRRAKGFQHKYSGKKREAQILIANIDQVMIIFPVKEPDFHPLLLDRFLAIIIHMSLKPIIVLNKWDLLTKEEKVTFEKIVAEYTEAGFEVICHSIVDEINHKQLKQSMDNKINFMLGPSGAGKSSLVKFLMPDIDIRLGIWSEKCKTGPQTTTATEIFALWKDTFLADTAGFSQIFLSHISKFDLRNFYPDFISQNNCKYLDCNHDLETIDECSIKQAVEQGIIPKSRHQRYLKLLDECCQEYLD